MPRKELYAVIGHPVAHSLSPIIHRLFARQEGKTIDYLKIDSPPGAFADSVSEFVAGGGRGLNVTAPFKEEARRLATTNSDRAVTTGAVNTLWFRDDGSGYGDNTDGAGLRNDFDRLGIDLTGARLLLVGAGGAARGILPALLEARPREIFLSNRSIERAVRIAADFNDRRLSVASADELTNRQFDGVINATSASLSGVVPDLPSSLARSLTWGYDLFYARGETSFTKWLKERGVSRAYEGTGMLVEQAAESFYLWRKHKPDTAVVIRALKDIL